MGKRRTVPLRAEAIEPHDCTPEVRRRILKALPFFRSLAERDISRCEGIFRERGFGAGQVVMTPGQPAEHLHVVVRGKLVMAHTLPSGQEVLLEVLAEGDFFGVFSPAERAPWQDTIRALTAGCMFVAPAGQFRRILEAYPAVALTLLELTGERLRGARETIEYLSAGSTEVRIAHALLRLADKLGTRDASGVLIQVPLSREDLAGLAATTPETVSRTLSRLQRDGCIEAGRRWVRIRDPRALGRLAAG